MICHNVFRWKWNFWLELQLSVITANFGRKRRQASNKSAEIENQLEVKKAAISSIKAIMTLRHSLHEF